MEFYWIIFLFYNEGYCIFICNLYFYIGLLGVDMIVMLCEVGKCLEIIFLVVILEIVFLVDIDKVYCVLYDDLIKQVDNKKIFLEKEFFGNVFVGGYIICYYDDFFIEMQQICVFGIFYINICKMIQVYIFYCRLQQFFQLCNLFFGGWMCIYDIFGESWMFIVNVFCFF